MSQSTSDSASAVPLLHDLFSRVIKPIKDWQEWLERWQAATTIDEMLGLLHTGFDQPLGSYHDYNRPIYDGVDRIHFYLMIADGWADTELLQRKDDHEKGKYLHGRDSYGNGRWKRQDKLRQIIASKAFDMLCHNFFKVELQDVKNGDEEDWTKTVLSEPYFSAIQRFFRIELHPLFRRIGIRNLMRHEDRSNSEKIAINFLLVLNECMWTWEEEDIPLWKNVPDAEQAEIRTRNETFRARIESAKPWLIEVLNYLDRLDLLDKRMLELSDACLNTLKEIAMRVRLDRYSLPVETNRKVETIEEACLTNSQAAWLLKRHELVVQEHTRLSKIQAAERVKEAADEKLKELTKK